MDVNSPEGRAAADAVLASVAPRLPAPRSTWDEVKKSPAHQLPILCNGESTAERDADGQPKDGTGNCCAHYWAFRRLPEIENAADIEKGERIRYCTKWQSADGPMEFGEGREHMANVCNGYVPSSPVRAYSLELEQAPPTKKEHEEARAAVATPPPPFDPGTPVDADFEWPLLFGRSPDAFDFVRDPEGNKRWAVFDKGNPTNARLFVPFRLAYSPEELAQDTRFPVGDPRRYDKDRLFALELCMRHTPINRADWDVPDDAKQWPPILNQTRAKPTIEDALRATLDETKEPK